MRLNTIIRYGLLYGMVAFFWACASTPQPEPPAPVELPLSALQVESQPPGAEITIKDSGQLLASGEKILLPAGKYTLVAKKTGYDTRTKLVYMDGETPQKVTIRMGKGFADLTVSSQPENATVYLSGQEHGRTPIMIEKLSEGEHIVELRKEGYFSDRKTITIIPGKPEKLDMKLVKVPTSAPLTIFTRPSGGEIYLDGKKMGEGEVHLKDLSFGKYTIRGILPVSEYERRIGSASFRHQDEGPKRFTLLLDQPQRLFEENWHNEKEAIALEQKRYRRQRVSRPIGLKSRLSDEAYQSLANKDRLDNILHAMLRVGDRLALSYDDGDWLIWKRHHSLTLEFKAAVAAFIEGSSRTDPWAGDEVAVWRSLAGQGHILSAIVFGMYAETASLTLVDLTGKQLKPDGETILRTTNDGPLVLAAKGGDNIAINKAEPISPIALDLVLKHLPASDIPLQLTWDSPPDRLLVVCESPANFIHTPGSRMLKAHEKHLVDLVFDRKVKGMVRLSGGPDYSGWARVVTQPTGPFADQINLNRDEIGPHDTAGNYERIWFLRYSQENAMSQRQVNVTYQVGGGIKDFSGDKFLRHPEEESPKDLKNGDQ